LSRAPSQTIQDRKYDIVSIFIDIGIGETKDGDAEGLDLYLPFFVVYLGLDPSKVSWAVDFNGEPLLRTVEVNDVAVDAVLSSELVVVELLAAQVFPEDSFSFWRRVS
jgi:hypothetical protein